MQRLSHSNPRMNQVPHDTQFHAAAAAALSTCQLVEHVVRFYLKIIHQLIATKLNKCIPYHFSGEDYEDLPLGALLKVFKKLNDNVDLQDRLEKFRKERNWVAHQIFADYSEKGQSAEERSILIKRAHQVGSTAMTLYTNLMLELQKVSAAGGGMKFDVADLLTKAAEDLETEAEKPHSN